jgi:hypothetical protein
MLHVTCYNPSFVSYFHIVLSYAAFRRQVSVRFLDSMSGGFPDHTLQISLNVSSFGLAVISGCPQGTADKKWGCHLRAPYGLWCWLTDIGKCSLKKSITFGVLKWSAFEISVDQHIYLSGPRMDPSTWTCDRHEWVIYFKEVNKIRLDSRNRVKVRWCRNLDSSTFISVSQEWIERPEQVIAKNGQYYCN